MSSVMKPVAAGASRDITSLRATIEWLRSEGLLIETDREVNPDLEITGLQKHFDGSLPMLFNKVKGDRKSTRLNSSLMSESRMPSSA